MDILGIFTQPADLRLRLHDKIDSHVEDFGPGAAEAKAELLTEAAAVVDAALDVGKDPDSHHLDPFYVSALCVTNYTPFLFGFIPACTGAETSHGDFNSQWPLVAQAQAGAHRLCSRRLQTRGGAHDHRGAALPARSTVCLHPSGSNRAGQPVQPLPLACKVLYRRRKHGAGAQSTGQGRGVLWRCP